MAVKIKGAANSPLVPLDLLHVGETFLWEGNIGMVIACPECDVAGAIDIETGIMLCDYDDRLVTPINLEVTYTIG